MVEKEVTLQVRLPQDVALALQVVGLEKESLPAEMRQALAFSLFRRQLLSIGRAAELAGIPLARFMELLAENEIPVVEYTSEDLADDLATLDRIPR